MQVVACRTVVGTDDEPVKDLVRKVGELDVEMLPIGIRNRSKVGKLLLGSTARASGSRFHARQWRSRRTAGNPVVAGDAGAGPMDRVALLGLDGCGVDASETILGSLYGALVGSRTRADHPGGPEPCGRPPLVETMPSLLAEPGVVDLDPTTVIAAYRQR